MQKHIPAMLAKTIECYVLVVIATCFSMNITFDLGMFHVGFDIFALVVNFIDDLWKH